MEKQKILRTFGILYRTYVSYASKSMDSLDISFSDSVFLVNIGENEGISQEEIATALAIDKAAIARSVKRMAQKGYILIRKSDQDKRANALYLSDPGKVLYQYTMKLNDAWLDAILKDLDSAGISNFAKTIDNIRERAIKI